MTDTAIRTELRPARGRTRTPYVVLGVGVLAAVVAVVGCVRITSPVNSDLGLAGTIGPEFWLGVGVLNLCLLWTVRRADGSRASQLRLALLLGLLVVIVYGAVSIGTGSPRTEVAWRHVGLSQVFADRQGVHPDVDAYFSWPGFFTGLGSFAEVSGIPMLTISLVAPILNGLLWTVGVLLVARALSEDSRVQWGTAWLFVLVSWVDQDYLSPQAWAFFLTLLALAMLLGPLDALPDPAPEDRTAWRRWRAPRIPAEPSVRARVGAAAVVMLIAVSLVPTHQLTPFLLLLALGVLTVLRRLVVPVLSALVLVAAVLWLVVGASAYLTGHPLLFTSSAGGSAGANVAARVGGSLGHQIVVAGRMGLTGAMLGLSVLWVLWRWRRGSLDWRVPLLGWTPFGVVAVQSYGGEMLMRSYLFALPFLAFAAAELLVAWLGVPDEDGTAASRWGRSRVVAAALITCAFLAVDVLGRYGNARFDTFTADEVMGTRALYSLAPPHGLLVAGSHPTPWSDQQYLEHAHRAVTDVCDTDLPATECLTELEARSEGWPVMVIVTRSNREAFRIQARSNDAKYLDHLVAALAAQGAREVYRNNDVEIWRWRP